MALAGACLVVSSFALPGHADGNCDAVWRRDSQSSKADYLNRIRVIMSTRWNKCGFHAHAWAWNIRFVTPQRPSKLERVHYSCRILDRQGRVEWVVGNLQPGHAKSAHPLVASQRRRMYYRDNPRTVCAVKIVWNNDWDDSFTLYRKIGYYS